MQVHPAAVMRNVCLTSQFQDHGLDTPQERIAAGKKETGIVTLSSYHEGGHVIIQIKDDGRGINREKVAAKDERVIMLGEKTGEELEQLLAHCYCMVHPSKVEGLAFVILEAMSHGKLVVMSDIPANRELVDHSGITFPVGDVDKLREVLQWLISDPVLVKIRGTRAIDVVRRLYNWDYITEKTESEYEKLLTHNT